MILCCTHDGCVAFAMNGDFVDAIKRIQEEEGFPLLKSRLYITYEDTKGLLSHFNPARPFMEVSFGLPEEDGSDYILVKVHIT